MGHTASRGGRKWQRQLTCSVLQNSGPAPLLCVVSVYSIQQVLGWSLKGGGEITFLPKLTARTLTHLNKQPPVPSIPLVYREMSVVKLKRCFRRFLVGGIWQKSGRMVLPGSANKCSSKFFPVTSLKLNSSHTSNLMCFLECKTAGTWGKEVKTAGLMVIGLGTKSLVTSFSLSLCLTSSLFGRPSFFCQRSWTIGPCSLHSWQMPG